MDTDDSRAAIGWRRLMAILAALVGGVLALMSWGALGHLFGGYQDSSPVTYAVLGGMLLVPGLMLIGWAVRQLLPRNR